MNRTLEKNPSIRSCGGAVENREKPRVGNLKLFIVVLCACSSLAGCASRGGILGVDCCADIPAGAVPEPPGTKVCNLQRSQVAAAELDLNVFYRADFVGKTAQLAPSALDRLARRAATGSLSDETFTVEPSDHDVLDQARLEAVGNRLADYGVINAQVELAIPASLGLSGPLAEGSVTGGPQFPGVRSGLGGRGLGAGNALGVGF